MRVQSCCFVVGPVNTSTFSKVCVLVVIKKRIDGSASTLPFSMHFRLPTLMCFQKYAFKLSSKTHLSIRVHATILMRFKLSKLKRSKRRELYVVKKVEFYAHTTNIRTYDIFGHRFHFDAFSTVHTRSPYPGARNFHALVSRHFQGPVYF